MHHIFFWAIEQAEKNNQFCFHTKWVFWWEVFLADCSDMLPNDKSTDQKSYTENELENP